MATPLIYIGNGVTRHPGYRLAAPLNFSLYPGGHLAVVGPNGGGKSLFVDMLTGAHPLLGDAVRYCFEGAATQRTSDNIRLISFRDVYGGSRPCYYQQRWNRGDGQTFPTVGEVLRDVRARLWEGTQPFENEDGLMRETGITGHLEKPVNLLSSGELRKLQLAKMLLSRPQLLIVDNPYIGLDVAARAMLTRLLEKISGRLTVMVVVCRAQDVPPFIKEVVPVEGKRVGKRMSVAAYRAREEAWEKEAWRHGRFHFPASDGGCRNGREKEPSVSTTSAAPVIEFRSVTVKYGSRTILRDFNWKVFRGERWALTGENGAGKSTLLSLVCADNPQGYACDISLFGQRRGHGESIWDIKRRIGYVSPEMFSTYRKPLPAIDIVASGLYDTIGLFRRASDTAKAECVRWLRLFGAEELASRNYLSLSSGERRLILLVRAFVKSPELLILDEPFHGLDTRSTLRARDIIDGYMASPSRTLIMVSHYESEFPRCIGHSLVLKRN